MSASSNSSQRLIRSPSTVTVDHPPLGFEALLRGPVRHVGDDRSEVAQPMHSLDVDAEVRREVPRARMYAVRSPGANRCRAPVVDVHTVRRRRGQFAPVECGVGLRDDRPRVRVGGRFAGEVAGVEFGEGGVDVVEVERDARRDPVVGVDLDDAEHLGVERLGALVAAREADTTESETLPAGRNDGRRYASAPDVGESPACSRSRHLDRVGSRRSRPDGDRRWKCRRPVSPPSRPSRGPRSTSRSARQLGLPRFPAAAPDGSVRRSGRVRRRGRPRRRFRSG